MYSALIKPTGVKMWSANHQHQHHLEICWSCPFLGYTLDQMRTFEGGAQESMFL